MRSLLVIGILGMVLLVSGCNKDQEVADIENEVKLAEETDYLSDTTVQQPSDSVDESAAMTPDVAPEETATRKEMPIRNNIDGFTVQVGAGSDYDNTILLVEKYNNRGYEPFVTEVDIEGELFYRVRIGVFETYEDAQQLAMELVDKYSTEFWIDNN